MENAAQRAYWNDRLRNNWGLHGVGLLVYGPHYNAWLYKVREDVFRRLVSQLDIIPSESNVLDVGCGTGFYIEQWRKLGVKGLTGIDISDVAISRLTRRFTDAKLYRMDVSDRTTHLGQAGFDVIGAFDVLIHIVDDDRYRAALKNIHRLLRDGGYFLFSDGFLHGNNRSHLDYWKGRSLSFIKAELEQAGFRILTRTPMFVLMNAPVDTRCSMAERYWRMAMLPVTRMKRLGFFAGGLMYPIELLLVRLLRESPSTEIMVCKKDGLGDQ